MSAFLVTDAHLDVIVSYFVDTVLESQLLWAKLNGKYCYVTRDNAHVAAYILYQENARSVNHRYQEEGSDETYKFEQVKNVRDLYSASDIVGAMNCLEYQSCECDDYYTTEAFYLLCSMRKHLLSELTEMEDRIWTIDEVRVEGDA